MNDQTQNPLFSVVVCTRNRSGLLSGLFDSLSTQEAPARHEILVVDNGSTDNTRAIVERYLVRMANLRYAWEPVAGLARARNAGWRAATGTYVAYVDDDCRVPPDWLARALLVVSRESPDMFGGPYHARFTKNPPRWFRPEYGAHIPTTEARRLMAGEYLSGGNLFVRREVLAALGGFPEQVGMIGDTLGFGEETALQERLRASVPDALIYADPALWVHHLVRPQKARLSWQLRKAFADGRDHAAIRPLTPRAESAVALMARAFLCASRFLRCLVFGLSRDRARYPYYQNWVVEVCTTPVRQFGAIVTRWRRRSDEQRAGTRRAADRSE